MQRIARRDKGMMKGEEGQKKQRHEGEGGEGGEAHKRKRKKFKDKNKSPKGGARAPNFGGFWGGETFHNPSNKTSA